jgi:hypothetical protein
MRKPAKSPPRGLREALESNGAQSVADRLAAKARAAGKPAAQLAQATPKRKQQVESRMQAACVKWFRYQYPQLEKALVMVPNAGKMTEKARHRWYIEGGVSGAADLLLLVPAGGSGCLCLEAKTETGRQSDEQIKFQATAQAVGNEYRVFRTVGEFAEIVTAYLRGVGQ